PVALRGVHASHNLVVHRPPQAGEGLGAGARVVGVHRVGAGALVVIRFSTTDRTGVAVTTTAHGSIYRGVELKGDEIAPSDSEAPPAASRPGAAQWQEPIDVSL